MHEWELPTKHALCFGHAIWEEHRKKRLMKLINPGAWEMAFLCEYLLSGTLALFDTCTHFVQLIKILFNCSFYPGSTMLKEWSLLVLFMLKLFILEDIRRRSNGVAAPAEKSRYAILHSPLNEAPASPLPRFAPICHYPISLLPLLLGDRAVQTQILPTHIGAPPTRRHALLSIFCCLSPHVAFNVEIENQSLTYHNVTIN
jgi:hypothetical protein